MRTVDQAAIYQMGLYQAGLLSSSTSRRHHSTTIHESLIAMREESTVNETPDETNEGSFRTPDAEWPDPEPAESPEEYAQRIGKTVQEVAAFVTERFQELTRLMAAHQSGGEKSIKPNRQERRAYRRGRVANNVPRVRG